MRNLLRFAAASLIAGTAITLTTAPVWAFSQQNLLPNGNYDFNYGPTDDKYKYKGSDSANKYDPNGSGFHFSVEGGKASPYGFRSFGHDDSPGPPDFSRPLGNGN